MVPPAICWATLTACSQKKSTCPPTRSFMRRTGAAIGHEARLHSGGGGEQQARHVRRRTEAAMRLLHALAVLLQVGDEFAQILGRKVLSCDNDGRRMGGEADRLEIPLRVVFQVRREHRRRDMRSHAARQQGVAVCRRRRDAGAAQCAAGAADILDHQRLAQRLGHGFGHDARDDIARAAGRERYHHGDLPRRIALRRGEHRCRHPCTRNKNWNGPGTLDHELLRYVGDRLRTISTRRRPRLTR